jgi:hypothetical protein
MNLITQAESDLEFTLEDYEDGFGVEIILIRNTGDEYSFYGQSTDISFLIDPNTGIGVQGRTCEVSLRLYNILGVIGEIPDKTEEGTGWIAKYRNVNGDEWTFAIEQVDVDRKIGIVKLTLSLLKNDG